MNYLKLVENCVPELFVPVCRASGNEFSESFFHVFKENSNLMINTEYSYKAKSRSEILAYDSYTNSFLLLVKFHPSIPLAPKK